MDEESALAHGAGPEVVAEEALDTEGQVVGQTAPPEGEEKKTATQERRERDKAHRERIRAERDAAIAEAETAKTRHERILNAGKAEKPPQEQDYQDPLEYVAAKAIWSAEQQRTQREAREIGEAEEAARKRADTFGQQEQALIEQSWASHVAEAKVRYTDFDAVALARDVPVSEDMARLIQTSEVGADVLYHLGRNKALSAEIAGMNSMDAARAIGRLEATVSAPRPRTSTNAPDPISPVKGNGTAMKDPSKMSFAEFKAYRDGGGKI